MSEKSLLPTVVITGLVTALAVSTYFHQKSLSTVNEMLELTQQQLHATAAAAAGLDDESIARRFGLLTDDELPQATFADTNTPASQPGDASDKWVYGNPRARFTLVEMTDTECPYCKDHFPLIQTLVESSGGKINAALMHIPVQGEASRRQAVAVECAGEQGGGEAAWRMMDSILNATRGNGQGMTQPTALLAGQMGLDQQRFIACSDSIEVIDRITGDLEAAISLGIAQTPSTLVYDNETSTSILLQGQYASPDGIVDAMERLALHTQRGDQ